VDWEHISSILLQAQERLRAAMSRGDADLPAGLEAWDRAVRSHNEWTAAASHALHAERRASEALDALAAWVRGQSSPASPNARTEIRPTPATPDAAAAA
jgi:hypothetical protein